MKKNQLTALKNKYYSNWTLSSKWRTGGVSFLLLVASGLPMLAMEGQDTNVAYEITQQNVGLVKGTIKDVNGEPLIGVNIVIKGSSVGAITDLD